MTPLAAAVLCLYAAAAVAAAALARRDRSCRPVAAYLGAVVAIDLCRWALRWAAAGAAEPPGGAELLGRHLEAALYLGAILALPGLAVAVVFGKPGPKPNHGAADRGTVGGNVIDCAHGWLIVARGPTRKIFFAGIGLWLLIALDPELRGAELLRLYQATELVAVLGSLGCLVARLGSSRWQQEGATVPLRATATLTAATAASMVAPRMAGGYLEAWPLVVGVNGLAAGYVLAMCVSGLLGRRAPA